MPYSKIVDFASKDALITGNPLKKVSGTELDAEFNAIASASALAIDLASVQTLSNKTLVAPILGTPASGILTNCTGTASGLSVGSATTATTATTLSGGSLGTIPYQSSAGNTAMLAAGAAGYTLRANGVAAPYWANNSREVLQVRAYSDAGGSTTSTTYVNLNVTPFSFTPASTSSTLMILISYTARQTQYNASGYVSFILSEGVTTPGYEGRLMNQDATTTYMADTYVPASTSWALSNTSLTARSFFMSGKSSNGIATAEIVGMSCVIIEVKT